MGYGGRAVCSFVINHSMLVLSAPPYPVRFPNIIVLWFFMSFAVVVVYAAGFVENVNLILHFVAENVFDGS